MDVAQRVDKATALQNEGRLEEAEGELRDALREDPSSAVAHSNLGVVLTEAGRVEEALDPLSTAVALAPNQPEPLINQASGFRAAGRPDEAESCLRKALGMAPNSAIAQSQLGLVLIDLDRLDEAEICCCQALAQNLDYAPGYLNLGAVYFAQAKPDDALEAYEAAAALDPTSAAAYSGLANALRHTGRFDDAIAAAQKAAALAPNSASSHYNLGLAYWEHGNAQEALSSFREALELDPSLERAGFLVAALAGEQCDTVPKQFVTALFDTHAYRFDANLVDELAYQIPAELRAAVNGYWGEPETETLEVIDLGCGTGLCGPQFRDISKRLIGCDLSPNMISQTKARGCYDQLYVEDLTDTLARHQGTTDLILAADVLIYVGDVQQTFAGVRTALRPGGRFVFSVEHETGNDFTLLSSGRFSHSENYLKLVADRHGLKICRIEDTEIRKVKAGGDEAIDGRIYVLESTS